ncbi:MAG: hypothetical protein IJ899_12780 [Blautia sp.]|nr:hypothetical protein [Blautia sp.]
MGLEKAIIHGKEYRKPYTGAKAVSRSCRNHGGCQWCEENRKYRYRKENEKTAQMLAEYAKGGDDH